MRPGLVSWIGFLILFSSRLLAQDTASLLQAHAHNDYLHTRPLLDALECGFCSVEADIFLVGDELLVAHTRFELAKDRTLKSLYLDPLRKRIDEHGSVHGDGRQFTLLIDLKSSAEATYNALDQLLAQYDDVFTHSKDKQVHERPVQAIISGNRPFEIVEADSSRFVGLDGRLADLTNDSRAMSSQLLPLISDNWTKHFRWRGTGELPEEDWQKLQDLVLAAHKQERRIRFWATPDRPEAWAVLKKANVDLINTDDLEGLSEFLQTAATRSNPSK